MNNKIKLLLWTFSITYSGSAICGIATFLSIDSFFGSLKLLSLALALKTLGGATVGWHAPKIVSYLGARTTCLLSQLIGLTSIAVLFLGFEFRNPILLIIGIVLSSIPLSLIHIVVNSEIKLQSSDDHSYRKISSVKEMIVAILLLASSLVLPFLLSNYNIFSLLVYDALTYITAAIIFYLFNFEKVQIKKQFVKISPLKLLERLTVKRYILSVTPVLLLAGLVPLLASSGKIELSKNIPELLRQSIWSLEAATLLISSLLYIGVRKYLGKLKLIDYLALNSILLFFCYLYPDPFIIMASCFLISLSIAFTFQFNQDNLILSAGGDPDMTYRYSSFSIIYRNLLLSLSPLILTYTLSDLPLQLGVTLLFVVQILFFILKRMQKTI